MGFAEESGLVAYGLVSASMYADWNDATSDGIVSGSTEDALEEMLLSFAPVDEDEEDRARKLPRQITGEGKITKGASDAMRRWSRQRMTSVIGPRVTALVDDFESAAGLVTQKAAELGWSKPRYTQALNELAARFGRDGIRGDIIETWWRTTVVNESFNRGLMAMVAEEPTSRLYPFVENTWTKDNNTRDDHRITYVVRITSRKIQDHLAPLGWNCRCGRRAINWREARERGFDPDVELPLGPAFTESGIAPAVSLGL